MKRKNPNRRGFYNHLDSMKRMEKDKDAFLGAARLERHESGRKGSTKTYVVAAISALLIAALILGHLSGYFIETLAVTCFISFFGLAISAI